MSYETEELKLLQKEISAKNPTDILQFCANYFNSKLELQRRQLWQQQGKAKAAGIELFPAVGSDTKDSGSMTVPRGNHPKFKSPFSNDPHLPHDETRDLHAPHSNSGGLFKGGFDFKLQDGTGPLQQCDMDDPHSQDVTTAPQPAKTTAKRIPVSFNTNRRTSISAEAMDPDKFRSDSWKPPSNNLSPEQKEELVKNLSSNFLFQQLDGSSKATVVGALAKKEFIKGDKIIEQGNEGDYFYIVERGNVDFYVNGNQVNSCGEGSSFGELALMYNSPRAATAVAASDYVTCWALDRMTFRRILLEGTFSRRLMYEDFLRDVGILSGLSPHEILKLADALTTEIYQKGDTIVTEGEQGENFYFIESGKCEVSKKDKGVVTTLNKGDYFGEIALLNDLPRQASVVALCTVIVATLGKSGFARLLGPAVEDLKRKDPTAVNNK